MAITIKFPKDGEGFEAEIKVGEDFHIVLRAVHTAVGPVSAVYDATSQKWTERRYCRSIDDAKWQAELIARSLFKRRRRMGEFPDVLDWQATG